MVRHHVVIAALGIAAASLSFDEARADPYRWCADYNVLGGIGGRNCYFKTIEQCRATVSGVGGMCVPNLFYDGVDETTPPARRTKRKKR